MHTRFSIQLVFILALLFAQQTGAAHTLHHALEDLAQHLQDKKAPHSDACGKCAAYAQLGNALSVATFDLPLPLVSGETIQHQASVFRSIPVLAADARAPPYS